MSADPFELLEAALKAKDRGAVQAFADTIAVEQHDPFRLTVAAVGAKEGRFVGEAEKILLRTVAAHRDSDAAHYELAVIYRITGRHNEAVNALMEVRRLKPQEYRALTLLLEMLHSIGAHPEAAALMPEARNHPEGDQRQLDLIEDFGDYVSLYPNTRARLVVDEVKRRYDWVGTERVAAEINAAMDDGRGFSLVRLGDGEGAFARIDPEDELRFARLYSWMRREWATLLFGEDFDPQGTGYASLVDTLMDVCAGADVAGVPYPSWIEHEYRVSSIRGVPCLLNTHRWLLKHSSTGPKPLLCNQIIHVDLHQQGRLEPIVRRARGIGLISSNSGLPELLKARFGLDDVEFFKIPGERYSSGLRDAEALAGVHFPFVFWDIIRRLSQPQNGRVFLIAAGTLAKYYAATIKRHGGVALDVGSLVDAWMKIPSRPGYDGRMAL